MHIAKAETRQSDNQFTTLAKSELDTRVLGILQDECKVEICFVFVVVVVVVAGFKESRSKTHLICNQSVMGGSRTHDPLHISWILKPINYGGIGMVN